MKALMTVALMMMGSLLFAQEVRTEMYENGQVKAQYTVFGNHVDVVAYYENGQIKETGSYLNNKPNGQYRQYDVAGVLISAGEFVNGKREGIWLFRAGDGDMLYQVDYVNNTRASVEKWVAVE